LRRRRQEEERIAAQNDFLRESLRRSHRLQQLQDQPAFVDRPIGVDNDAFLEDEDAEKIVGEFRRLFARLSLSLFLSPSPKASQC
jgi:MAGUK p55 subfamily member 5